MNEELYPNTNRLNKDEVHSLIRENDESSDGIIYSRDEIKELESRTQEAASYTNHLANIISGVNHEVSPWIGGTLNMITRLLKTSSVCNSECKNAIECNLIRKKLENAVYSLEQAVLILSTLSGNVKKLKEHSLYKASLKDTIESWIKVTLLDRYIKEMIQENNIQIYSETLDFSVKHSPMYLAQIVFNLAKNTIDHNPEMLEDLTIKIYGSSDNKALIYEDNGKGISEDVKKNIFRVGHSTKNDEQQHGLGLSACMDYCVMMNATILCSSKSGRTRFVIQFETSYEKLRSDEFNIEKMTYKEKQIQLKIYQKYSNEGSGTYEAYNGDLPNLSKKNS